MGNEQAANLASALEQSSPHLRYLVLLELRKREALERAVRDKSA